MSLKKLVFHKKNTLVITNFNINIVFRIFSLSFTIETHDLFKKTLIHSFFTIKKTLIIYK